jgi:hypothetical protein
MHSTVLGRAALKPLLYFVCGSINDRATLDTEHLASSRPSNYTVKRWRMQLKPHSCADAMQCTAITHAARQRLARDVSKSERNRHKLKQMVSFGSNRTGAHM